MVLCEAMDHLQQYASSERVVHNHSIGRSSRPEVARCVASALDTGAKRIILAIYDEKKIAAARCI